MRGYYSAQALYNLVSWPAIPPVCGPSSSCQRAPAQKIQPRPALFQLSDLPRHRLQHPPLLHRLSPIRLQDILDPTTLKHELQWYHHLQITATSDAA